ncbi:MAG: rbsA4 [Devosia sp.]|uniref:sugar ABC transporter ATP-binding protein n=1 Tax=Devosia sp. TaxID=1871048 RepID=UPI002614F69D|nr:sugar ABC transporter ATP-binding protein [Devosia sp.]MDB5588183.1 rbsA4 [Devosia sp.]
MSDQSVLEIRNISKNFGPVQALTDVSFSLAPGEVHALCGENGAGKSTLMNIIAGILQPSSGNVVLNGQAVTIASPATAQRLGIGLVHQEIALCRDATVAENILMAATNARRAPLMNYRQLNADAQQVMNRLAPIPVSRRVAELSISNQQLVEIAKALTLDCRVLIFDEPTAALTESEAQALFGIIRELKSRGISIIYISHRMAEIFALCDRVTVLRDGRHVSTDRVADMTPDDVVRRMVGREITQMYPPKAQAIGAETLLAVENLVSDDVGPVSLALKRGEILGIGGLIGSGRTELALALCGLTRKTGGSVRLAGQAVDIGIYADAVRQGLVYLSEDRKHSGVFLDLSIAQNISVLDLGKLTRSGLIDRRAEAAQAISLATRLGVKMGGIADKVASLSGGNQQKVAIAKQLSVKPKVIIMDEPTRGIDVGAKSEIHKLLRQLADAGTGIIVISSELPELIGIADRVLVMREGQVTGELTQTITEEAVIRLASGLKEELHHVA